MSSGEFLSEFWEKHSASTKAENFLNYRFKKDTDVWCDLMISWMTDF